MQNPNSEDKHLKTNPKHLILGGLLVIFIFFGGLVAWSIFLPFSGAVIAPGLVTISQERKTVQHLEGGIVEKILVQPGDEVEKDQPLIILKRSEVNSTVSLLSGQIWAKMAAMARLRAESVHNDTINWPLELKENKDKPEVADAMKMEKDIFKSRRLDLTGQIDMLNSQINQLNEQVLGASEELKAQHEVQATLEEEIQAKQSLFDENYIDKAQLLQLKRQRAEGKGRVGRLKQSIAEINQKIEEFKMRIVSLKNKYKEESLAELGKTQDIIFQLEEQLRPKEDAMERLTIRAPIAGEILNMRIHSEDSGVIQPGQPIMEIVPKDARLIIEAHIQPDKITHVKKGQKARVQLSAFNRRTTPPVAGEVIYVSADQVTRETAAGQQSFYLAHIQVSEKELKAIGAYLSPGMPAVSYIETDKRTIIGYLLDPILEMLDRSLRES
ncbi:MAG: HlyD family type I secretion periplasmic adaptor subunit [Desulfosalsimonadaceae bacterium]